MVWQGKQTERKGRGHMSEAVGCAMMWTNGVGATQRPPTEVSARDARASIGGLLWAPSCLEMSYGLVYILCSRPFAMLVGSTWEGGGRGRERERKRRGDSSLRAVLERPDVPMAQCRSMPVRPLRQRLLYPVCAVGRSTGAAECTPPSGVPRDVAQRCSCGQPAGASKGEEFCTDKWHYTIIGAPGHGRSAAGDLSAEGDFQYETQRRREHRRRKVVLR